MRSQPGMNHPHLTGIACGIGAGALWGLVFLAPTLVDSFGPLQLTAGRYLCYGLLSLLLLRHKWAALSRHIKATEWRQLAWLSFTGNTLYYVLLASAVQIGGVAMTSLVVGFMPVAVTIIGSRDRDAVPLRALTPSLLLCMAGAVCIGWQALVAPAPASLATRATGLLCAIGALVSWTTYAVSNARSLTTLTHIKAHDWSLLIGLTTGAQSLALLPFAWVLEPTNHTLAAWLQLGGVSVALAVVASIVGNALWNRMSQLLPLTLVGQMILFETLFALVYGFLWEQRWPTLLEAAAFVLVVLSVVSCIAAHRRPPPTLAPA